tara:strand:- start:614 stop:1897 length:1284 start_codon:yes stop_codon:yes gene_type:complete
MFNPYKFIETKKLGLAHSPNSINDFIKNFLADNVENSQMSAWLMAVFFNGLNNLELNEYVNSIISSGKQLNFSKLNGFIVDKHSTGGVGDKVSLIAGPILAACNCYVPMIVGRSLAHTGGTLDKLETIKGYLGNIDINEFKKNVIQNKISIVGQSKEICPADKYIYSIRDITSTIDSLPLICASIISKKKAEGIQGLVLDIKVGNGAFMKTTEHAKRLGQSLTALGNSLEINSQYIISDMNQPLGKSAGLWCEIEESINFLQNKNIDKYLYKVVHEICSRALKMSGQKECDQLIVNAIESGKAYEIFEKMVKTHKGNLKSSYKENIPKYRYTYNSKKSGYLSRIDTEKLGYLLLEIGGGRKTTNDKIDPSCGLHINKKLNDKIDIGEPIIEIFGNNKNKIDSVEKIFDNIIFISNKKNKDKRPIIYE